MHAHPAQTLAATALALLLACGGGSGNPPLGGSGGGGGGGGGTGGGGTTISGQVVDQYGQSLAGRTVRIGASSTTTSATGQFTLTGVTTPYDLVILEAAPAKVATVYAQLTRSDPRLVDLGASTVQARSATLGGNIAGGDPIPTPSGTLTEVSWGSPEASTYAFVTSGSHYSFDLPWAGATTITGAVHGLQFTLDANGTVTGYHSHGVTTGVSLTDQGMVSNADLLLTATLTDDISTTIGAPVGHEIVERDVFLTFDDGAGFLVSQDGLDGGSLRVPVPSGIGAKAVVTAYALNGDGSSLTAAQITGLAPGTTGATLTLPLPAVATAPLNGATGVDTSTDLVWTPVAGGIHLLYLSGAANDPGFAIVSGGTHVRIPDLSAQGLGLPSGHPYDFGLVGIGPCASVDAFTATSGCADVAFRTQTGTSFTTR